jgi:predicted deacylase
MSADHLIINDQAIPRGEARTVHLHLAKMYDTTELAMPVRVIRGLETGPTIFVSGAIHGDEIVGPEVIRRLLMSPKLKQIRGTLIAVPIVNVFGYNARSRFLPDGRDLNRVFPGSRRGSLAARIASRFMAEIVAKADLGIDIHSAPQHRFNLPQIRANLDDAETLRLAKNFGTPVLLNSKLRDGSMREAADKAGIRLLLFEGGEGLRHDNQVIKLALRGIWRTMVELNMLPRTVVKKGRSKPFVARGSHWIRSPQSGSLRTLKSLGAFVSEGTKLATINDAMGTSRIVVRARSAGIIIGESRLPLVNKGDALFHIATIRPQLAAQFEDQTAIW